MKSEKETLEAAKKFGYTNLFTHRNNMDEMLAWIDDQFSGSEKARATIAMMVTLNTLAVMRAREEEQKGETK